ESEDDFAEAMSGYAAQAGTLGRRLAELHAVLARPADDPAFDPEPATEADSRQWAAQAVNVLQHAMTLLEQRAGVAAQSPQPTYHEDVETLLALRGHLPALAERLAAAAPDSLQTRIHGDFHLGQVLIAQN